MLSKALAPSARYGALRALPRIGSQVAPRHFAAAVSRADKVKASLIQQLKVAELKGWTEQEISSMLAGDMLDGANTKQHALDVLSQVNDLALDVDQIFYNSPAGVLYEQALKYEKGSEIVSSGALSVKSGKKTGRSPLDKRIVDEAASTDDIWWGKVNIKLPLKSFLTNRERAVDYLNVQERLYIVDGWCGWDPEYRVPVRVITSRPYHALFMQNMLVPPTDDDLTLFEAGAEKNPFVIFNAGVFPANRQTEGMTSSTSVAVSFERQEMVILGTQYAGCMKKGAFTVMNYLMPLMPKRDLPPAERALPVHVRQHWQG